MGGWSNLKRLQNGYGIHLLHALRSGLVFDVGFDESEHSWHSLWGVAFSMSNLNSCQNAAGQAAKLICKTMVDSAYCSMKIQQIKLCTAKVMKSSRYVGLVLSSKIVAESALRTTLQNRFRTARSYFVRQQ